MSLANCEALQDLFTDESGRIAPEIQRRLTGKNVMIDEVEKGPWEDGMGEIVNVLTVERSIVTGVTDDAAWQPMAPQSTGDNGPCLPNVYQISFGQTQRQMQLYTRAIESPDICLELLRPGFSLTNQLDITFQSLTQGLQWELEKQAMNQYILQSGNLICVNSIVGTGAPVNPGSVGWDTAYPPNSTLDQGFLDFIYYEMDREVCGDGAIGMADGQNIYALVTDAETSRNLKTQNADIRQDLRYAWMGAGEESPLVMPYGISGRCYGNYSHIINQKMPRYDLINGQYVRQSYWLTSPAATKGNAPIVNPSYLNAEFSTTFIFNPKVYKWLIPGMLNSPGGDMAYTTPNYFPAQFRWLNILDRTCNPDGTIGFYRGRMAMAPMPLHPSYGWCILHQRSIPPIIYFNNGLST
jgi:hypothetical protein